MYNNFQTEHFLSLQPICRDKLHYFSQLESTSDYAKELVKTGAASGTLVLAEHQTTGRGRNGNTWLSNPGDALLFTLIIDPDIDLPKWNRFSLVAGLALLHSILKLSPSASVQLKWPNDIYINHKKCAGILSEIIADKILIGIGINITNESFPPELSNKATSLLREGIHVEKEAFLANIVSEIYQLGSLAGSDFHHIISLCNEHSMLNDQPIQFLSAGKTHTGICQTIADDGSLIVKHGEEFIHYQEAKDIRILK